MTGAGPVLLLGGTGEARAVAALLVDAEIPVVSSLAGRVSQPRLPVGEVRVGGFGGPQGLAEWVHEHDSPVVVDATHPFAQTISRNAVRAAGLAGVPLVAVRRPAWEPGPADRWTVVDDIAAAAATVAERGGRVLLTTGRQDVGAFAAVDTAWFLVRVVDPPTADLPPHHRILRSRGPYDLESERALLRDDAIDLVVTKNSGGELTRAKLIAAAERGLEVVMVRRPPTPEADHEVSDPDEVMGVVQQILTGRRSDAR
ncbi:cobalt-precorrin-6A reductase [uncultured Williamsia sp.]|uniref:cobalt-precorrin-6A reductase n=1 Tax=uncultured Williamsia sp. TaxID=259311 RepID=UPI002631108F|nr:cobalt-precorrin-6A reductase [uncultured Williamsia sp.]